MGYKLAGFDVIGANDIDPEMAWHYKKNHNPKHYFLCPIRDLLTMDLPPELYELDVLDGSPPCSSFSMAGNREKDWGKNKHFREGQAKQVLDDLFFDFLDVAERLQPKVIIAENVKGMLIGNAKGYTKMVVCRFKELGYQVQVFLVNAADCGVPQRRERVFFCAIRVKHQKLSINPKLKWVSAGGSMADINASGLERITSTKERKYWNLTPPGSSLAVGCKKSTGKNAWFNNVKLSGSAPSCTLSSNCQNFTHWSEPRRLALGEWIRLGSFPDDYIAKTPKLGKYLIGMSVPPKMMQVVAEAVRDQWLIQTEKELQTNE